MKRLSKFFMLGVIIAMFVALIVPISAQDDVVEPAGPGEGGIIIEANTAGDPRSLVPMMSADTTSSGVYGYFYPTITAVDPATGQFAPNQPGAMAESWEYDETGTVLTMHLREDMFWSDGVQITADDYLWSANAIRSGLTTSTRTSMFYDLADGTVSGGPVHEITKVDDFTLEFLMGGIDTDENGDVVLDENGDPVLLTQCNAFLELTQITPLPAHVYGEVIGEDYAAMNADPYFFPETENGPATFGMFTDPFIEFGVGVSLLMDPNYTDTTQLDFVSPGEWFLQSVADSNVAYERFLAGDFTSLSIPATRQNEFRILAEETGDFQILEYTSGSTNFLGFNTADPTNPQNGQGPDGLIDQGLHPIFGDPLVREAIYYALSIEEMIGTHPDGDTPATGIMEGNGAPMFPGHVHPVYSSLLDDLASVGLEGRGRPFDPDQARALLDEAGWTDSDGDGVRECNGCLYATEVDPSYEGTPFEFELITGSGGTVRPAAGETIRAQLVDFGIVVNFQAIEFGTLVGEILGQTHDAVIIGITNSLPVDFGSSARNLFFASSDVVGGGLNMFSYQNSEFEALVKQADTLAGCDPDERDVLYAQALVLWNNDLPYIPLFHGNVMYAVQGSVENFDPYPYYPEWNIDSWVLTSE